VPHYLASGSLLAADMFETTGSVMIPLSESSGTWNSSEVIIGSTTYTSNRLRIEQYLVRDAASLCGKRRPPGAEY
jgi:hypothetical protein